MEYMRKKTEKVKVSIYACAGNMKQLDYIEIEP
jgi:hypothetical protein